MKSKKRVWVGFICKDSIEDVFEKSEDGLFLHLTTAITNKKHNASPYKIRITVEELPCKMKSQTKKPTE